MAPIDILERVTSLPAEDRVEVMTRIWESLEPTYPPIADSTKQMLQSRLVDFYNDPMDGRPAAEVVADLRNVVIPDVAPDNRLKIL